MLVVLSGKKYSGKDSVARYLASTCGYPVIIHRWAYELRKDIVKMLNAVGDAVSMDDLLDDEKKGLYVPLMQAYGTDYRRAQNKNYWVERGLQIVLQPGFWPCLFVNVDTRFPNEVDICRSYGFPVIRLTVSPEKQYERARTRGEVFTEKIRLHPSETALDDYDGFDLVVDSEAPLADVCARVVAFLGGMGIPFGG